MLVGKYTLCLRISLNQQNDILWPISSILHLSSQNYCWFSINMKAAYNEQVYLWWLICSISLFVLSMRNNDNLRLFVFYNSSIRREITK